MIDQKQLPTDTQIKYYKWTYWGGFGLWWLCLLMLAYLPDEDISERAATFLLVGVMAYAVMAVLGLYLSGFSKAMRATANKDTGTQYNAKSQLISTALGWLIFFFISQLFLDQDWLDAALSALAFSAIMSLWWYISFVRKPKEPTA